METVNIETSFSKCNSGHGFSIKICFVNETTRPDGWCKSPVFSGLSTQWLPQEEKDAGVPAQAWRHSWGSERRRLRYWWWKQRNSKRQGNHPGQVQGQCREPFQFH